jgi:hypothetical protein
VTERAAPPVTISGGAAGSAPHPVDTGPDPERDRRARRRRRSAAVVVGAGLLAALGVAEVSDRRAAAEAARAEERRERGTIDLVLGSGWSTSADHQADTDRISYSITVKARNYGPRTVEVLAVDLPSVRLSGPVVLEAGSERDLTVVGGRSCADPQPPPAPDSLPLQVRTEAGPRSVDLRVRRTMFDLPVADLCGRAGAAEPTAQPAEPP